MLRLLPLLLSTLPMACLVNSDLYEQRRALLLDEDQDGWSLEAGDCDDQNAGASPGLVETPYDGVDNDCNPATADDDLDQDSYRLVDDCNDADADINPSMAELYGNMIDEDCSGVIDDGDASPDSIEAPDPYGTSYVEDWSFSTPLRVGFGDDAVVLESACDALVYELNSADGSLNPVVDAAEHGWCSARADGVLELVVPVDPGAVVPGLPSADGGWNAGIYLNSRPWLIEESTSWTCALVYLPSTSTAQVRAGRDCTPTWGDPGNDILDLFTIFDVARDQWQWVCLGPEQIPGVGAASGRAAGDWPGGVLTNMVPEGHPFCTGWGQIVNTGESDDAVVYLAGFLFASNPDSWDLRFEVAGCGSGCEMQHNLGADYEWVAREPDSVESGTAVFSFDTADLMGLVRSAGESDDRLVDERQIAFAGAEAAPTGWWVESSRTEPDVPGLYAAVTIEGSHRDSRVALPLGCASVDALGAGAFGVTVGLGPDVIQEAGVWGGQCEDYFAAPYVEFAVDGCDGSCILGHQVSADGSWIEEPPLRVEESGAVWAFEPSISTHAVASARTFAVSGVPDSPDGWLLSGAESDWTVPQLYAPSRWHTAFGVSESTVSTDCTYISEVTTGVFQGVVVLGEESVLGGGSLGEGDCVLPD